MGAPNNLIARHASIVRDRQNRFPRTLKVGISGFEIDRPPLDLGAGDLTAGGPSDWSSMFGGGSRQRNKIFNSMIGRRTIGKWVFSQFLGFLGFFKGLYRKTGFLCVFSRETVRVEGQDFCS